MKQSRGTRPEMRSKHVNGVVDGAQGVNLVLHAFLGKCTLLSNSPVCFRTVSVGRIDGRRLLDESGERRSVCLQRAVITKVFYVRPRSGTWFVSEMA